MESSTSKVDIMKPLLFKAGIPLTLSVAAFVFARLLARRGVPKDSVSETRVMNSIETDSEFGSEDSFYDLSSCFPSAEYEETLVVDAKLEEEILGLKVRIEDLQRRESELEMRFLRYNDLKERESVLMQLRNMMLLEMAQSEFLDREISLMEEESRRLGTLVEQYLRILEQLEYWKSRSGLLQRKVKNLLRRKRVQSRILQEKDLKTRAREAEFSRTREALEKRTNDVKKMEGEIRELKMVLDQMQEEKNELLNKLELFEEKPASSLPKIEAEGITIEEENMPTNEDEKLKKDQEWTSAYSRHENEKKGEWEMDFGGNLELENHASEEELEIMALEKNENEFGTVASDHQACSKRKKLLQRLRKWVEGCEKGKGKVEERERQEVKCFGRHSVSYEADQEHLQGRRSCSSV